MAEARFYGTDSEEYFSLRREATGVADQMNFVASYIRAGKKEFSREVAIASEDLRSLADWLENFWNETPPQILADALIRFIYSHREHIGEGYYDIEFSGSVILRVYEQLGTSNTFRAEEVRALLK